MSACRELLLLLAPAQRYDVWRCRLFAEVGDTETTDSLEPVADRVGGWPARHVVADPALNQIGVVGVAEEDEGGTIVEGLAVTGNLPSFLQHGADRRRVFGRGRGVNRQCELKPCKETPPCAACSAVFYSWRQLCRGSWRSA